MKPIKIQTRKVVEQGIAKREILFVDALKQYELPQEYLTGDNVYLNGSELHISSCENLVLSRIIPETEFQKKLTVIRAAGNRLHEINKKVKKLKEEWKGEETIII